MPPPPHDCLAQGHGTSPEGFPVNTGGVSSMDMARKPISGQLLNLSTPRHNEAHDMDGLSRCPKRPQIRPRPVGETASDG
jgi:hypothetical protein